MLLTVGPLRKNHTSQGSAVPLTLKTRRLDKREALFLYKHKYFTIFVVKVSWLLLFFFIKSTDALLLLCQKNNKINQMKSPRTLKFVQLSNRCKKRINIFKVFFCLVMRQCLFCIFGANRKVKSRNWMLSFFNKWWNKDLIEPNGSQSYKHLFS